MNLMLEYDIGTVKGHKTDGRYLWEWYTGD